MPIKVTFSCTVNRGEVIYIVGSHKLLGNWTASEGLQLHGFPIASAKIKLTNCSQIAFKACKYYNSKSEWEFPDTTFNRTVTLSSSNKLGIEFKFNDTNTVVKVVMLQGTKTKHMRPNYWQG
jgi:hypothetical protein